METIAIALISFLLGITQNLGICAQPALDYKSPAEPERSVEIAVPIKAGLNPPGCPPGG